MKRGKAVPKNSNNERMRQRAITRMTKNTGMRGVYALNACHHELGEHLRVLRLKELGRIR